MALPGSATSPNADDDCGGCGIVGQTDGRIIRIQPHHNNPIRKDGDDDDASTSATGRASKREVGGVETNPAG